MFERFKKAFEQAIKQAAASVDTEVFDHPLAQKTDWHPMAGGGSNFQTHRLDSTNPDQLIFKCSKGAYLFSGAFIFFGLLGMVIPLVVFFNGGMQEWGMVGFALLFGGIFLAVGVLMLYFMTVPRVFDTFYGCYYQARKKPEPMMASGESKKNTLIQFNDIKAVQVIRERIRSKNGSYYSYEINLVLQDASRVNVIDHGKHQAVIEDAEILAQALGVPLWDGS